MVFAPSYLGMEELQDLVVDDPHESLLEGIKGFLAGLIEHIVHVEPDELLLVGASDGCVFPVRLEGLLDDVPEVGLGDGEGEAEDFLLVPAPVVQEVLYHNRGLLPTGLQICTDFVRIRIQENYFFQSQAKNLCFLHGKVKK